MSVDLKVKVTADTVDVTQKMDGVKAKGESVAKSFSGIGSAIAGAFAIGAIIQFSKGLAEAANNVRDISESLDVSATNLQTIRMIGLFSGQDDPGKVDAILGKLEKARRAALDGDKTASESFKSLGVSMMSVAGPLDDLLEKVTRQRRALEGNNAASQAMFDIFGKSTALQQQFFNSVADGIDSAKEKFQGFNVILGDEYINQLNDADEKTKIFWASFKAWASIALVETGKAIKTIGDALSKLYESGKRGFQGDFSAAPDMKWIEAEEKSRRAMAGVEDTPATVENKKEDLEAIAANKTIALKKEIEELKAQRTNLYNNIGTTDPADGAKVQAQLESAEAQLKKHLSDMQKQRDSAADAELKIEMAKAKKEMEENKKVYETRLAFRKKAESDAKQARESLELLAFDRAKVVKDQDEILKGEKLGAFKSNPANSLTSIGGMLGAQSSGMSEAARQTKIQEQMLKYNEDNAKSLFTLEKNTREANAILASLKEAAL